MTYTLHLGDCRAILATIPDDSIDAIVTDPPYELGFMGKSWDSTGIDITPEYVAIAQKRIDHYAVTSPLEGV